MKGAELFCGMGMSSLGLVSAGVDLLIGVDISRSPVEAFNLQSFLPPVAVQGSVAEVSLPAGLDLISGGPVCKAFSPGATRYGTLGQQDPRNTFPLMFSDLATYEPTHVLIENTVGLLRFSSYVEELLNTLSYMGYHTITTEVDVFDYGVPQHRKRALFLGSRRGRWVVPEPRSRLPGPEVVGDVMYEAPKNDPWPLVHEVPEQSLNYYLRSAERQRKHRPLTMGLPANTVTATYSKGAPYGIVVIEGKYFGCGPRLAARLQGLPDEYDLSSFSRTAALTAIGNGFPYQVVEYMLQFIP
jgi:site-specific DNA-cytosine methylase